MNTKSYYNTSLLLLHENHLENYSLHRLYILRNKYLNNNNFIVEKFSNKIINIIDNVIKSKVNGIQLLEVIKENNILYKTIKSENIKIEDNIKLLQLYKNINIMEKLMGLYPDSLFNKEQYKSRIYLTSKIFLNNFIEKILLCKF